MKRIYLAILVLVAVLLIGAAYYFNLSSTFSREDNSKKTWTIEIIRNAPVTSNTRLKNEPT